MRLDFGSRIWFAYLVAVAHLVFLGVIGIIDGDSLVEKIGIPDFPITLLAGAVLMNVDISAIWVGLYFAVVGALRWYLLGRFFERFLSGFGTAGDDWRLNRGFAWLMAQG